MVSNDPRLQLRNLGRMRTEGKITPEGYDARVALMSDASLEPAKQTAKQGEQPSKTNEEWMVHYLKEQTTLLESIKGWVTFFGILTVISLVLWVILIVVAVP